MAANLPLTAEQEAALVRRAQRGVLALNALWLFAALLALALGAGLLAAARQRARHLAEG